MSLLRLRSGQFLALAAIVTLLIAGYTLNRPPSAPVELPSSSVMIIIGGVIVLAVAVWLLKPPIDVFTVSRTPMEAIPINWVFVGLGILPLAAFLAVNRQVFQPISIHFQMALFVSGVALITLGFCGIGRNLLTGLNNFYRGYKTDARLVALGGLELVVSLVIVWVLSLLNFALNPVFQSFMYGIGIAAIAIGLGGTAVTKLFHLTITPLRIGMILVGIAILAGLLATSTYWITSDFLNVEFIQAILFVASILLILLGLGILRPEMFRLLITPKWLLLFLITLLAFVVRVWFLSGTVRFLVDEQHFYIGVIALQNDPNTLMLSFIDPYAALPHFFSYAQQIMVWLFGPDFAGIRMASVFFGTFTVIAVYFAGDALFDRKTALIAAAMLAVFPPAVHFSRLSIINIADPLFGTLAIMFLVRGLRYNSQRDYVLAGMNLALTSYFYEGGRLLFGAAVIFWLGYMLLRRRPWSHRRGLLLMVATIALLITPYYVDLLSRVEFAPRLNFEFILGDQIKAFLANPNQETLSTLVNHYVLDSLQYAVSHTIYGNDRSYLYYGGDTGIVLWFVVPFYLLGLFFILWRAPDVGMLLLFWIGLGLLGIGLILGADWTVRFIALFPAMTLAIAIGIRYPLQMVIGERRYLFPAIAVITVILMVGQVVYYWGQHLPAYNVELRRDRTYDSFDVVDRVLRSTSSGRLYYITDKFVSEGDIDSMLKLRRSDLSFFVWKPEQVNDEKLDAITRDTPIAFAMRPDDIGSLERLKQKFNLEELPWSVYSSVPLSSQYAIYLYRPG